MNRYKKVYLSLPEELHQKICLWAEETYRTRAGYIRQIIKAYVREMEQDPAKKIK